MILRPEANLEIPIGRSSPHGRQSPALRRPRPPKYHLVRQPDHARLSGQIAEQLAIAGAPPVDDDIVCGISLHDEGWADFDSGRTRFQATHARYDKENVPLNAEGKPLSFLEIKAADFLRAWRGSIEAAEAVAPSPASW